MLRNDFTAWILRASVSGFTAGCRLLLQDVPYFGDLVKVQLYGDGAFCLFGLIYDVIVQDDPVVRQLILADALEPEVVLDQRENRLVPIELSVLTVGYELGGKIIQGVAPQPPVNLDSLVVCDETELRAFTANLTYLRVVLNTTQIPADELLVVHLNRAAVAHPTHDRYQFLITAGRHLARVLDYDLTRLEGILRRIRPK